MTVAADVEMSWCVRKAQSSMVCVVVMLCWMIDHRVVVVLVVVVCVVVVAACKRNILAVPNRFLSKVFVVQKIVSVAKS